MKMKLILAAVPESESDEIIEIARKAGATGATVITGVRGEGLHPQKSFLGLDLTAQRDLILFVVAEPLARTILEAVGEAAGVDEKQGAGMAMQLEIEDTIGLKTQLPTLLNEIEDEI